MLIRCSFALLAVLATSSVAPAQFEWDKHTTGRPVQNPAPVAAKRADIISEVKELLDKNQIPIDGEHEDETKGVYVFTTQPVVFGRGIVALTQLGHFAEVGAPDVQNVVRARVTLRIEVAPSTPTTCLVGVSATFEGLRQGPSQQWVRSPSRGLLEDKFLKHVIMDVQGTSFDDVRPDENILEVNDAGNS